MLTFETVVHAGFLLKQTLKMVEMQLFLTWNVDEKQHMGHIYSNLPVCTFFNHSGIVAH